MPCEKVKIGDNFAIVCSRGRKAKNCFYCSRASEALCDYPIKKQKNGKFKTCDRNLCDVHRQKGVSANVDFCKEHYPLAKAAYERRMEKIK